MNLISLNETLSQGNPLDGWTLRRCGRGRQEKCCVGVLCDRIIYSVGMCLVRGGVDVVLVMLK